jgi:hypothetical protein
MRIKKTDPLTGQVFSAKPNQRFQTATNRVRFNNDKAIRHRRLISSTAKPLNTNIKVLERLLKDEEQMTFHTEFLKGASINLNICTGFVSEKGKNYPCIYHYMIKPLDDNMVLIKKMKL